MKNPELNADILATVAARIEENKQRSCIDLQELIRSTQFTKQEIRCMYRGFKQVSCFPKCMYCTDGKELTISLGGLNRSVDQKSYSNPYIRQGSVEHDYKIFQAEVG